VGPNSSGKSNLFDALKFISDLARIGQEAVRERGSFSTIAWSGRTDQKISFDLQGNLLWDQSSDGFHYSIEISGRPFEWFETTGESFLIYRNNEFHRLLEFPDANRMASIYGLDGKQLSQQGLANVGSQLHFLSSPERHDPLSVFSRSIQEWEVYDPTPALMRESVKVKRELKLKSKGENLAGVLHTLRSEFPVIFETIEEHLRMLVPESRKLLSLLTAEGGTYPGLEENEITSKVPVAAMSAGTLRFLAFLAVVYSPEAPQLVCFEEPENNIHPHALELLVDVLKGASRKRQVLVSTHSPYLLNFIDVDSVFVFEKTHGETKVTEPGSKKNLKSLLRKLGLGEAWYAGTIGGVPARTK
jgi:predicted ATPase